MGCNGPGRQAGFVLAVTLWLLAGVAVATGLMMLWASRQVEHARIDSERFLDEVAVSETRDTLLYIASTRELTLAGLPVEPLAEDQVAVRRLDEMGGLIRDPIGGELRLDGSRYRGRGAATFAIQDESGLFSMVWPPPFWLDRFLRAEGVEPDRIGRLIDSFLDYVDQDDLVRLQGAERREYERDRRAPPPNRTLLLPTELGRIMGWDELPSEQLQRIIAHVTVYYGGAVNLNTVPEALLPAWVPNCPEGCEAILRRRSQTPLVSTVEAELLAGAPLPGDSALDYRYVAEGVFRLDVWGRTGRGHRYHVKLTPLADQRGPWSILAAYPVDRPADDDTANATASPLLAGP